jgi:FixJ family two-component response regulator
MTDQEIVYIVDDDPDIGKALVHLLRVSGYNPCLFASITEFNSRANLPGLL